MKTDDLIGLLVEDSSPLPLKPRRAITYAILGGAAIGGAIFMVTLGLRPDIAQALASYRFLFKLLFTIAVVITAVALMLLLYRPEASVGRSIWLLAIAPGMLVTAALIEMAVMPSSTWLPRMIGTNARFCLTMIPLLSIIPLFAFLTALRQAAPTNPGLAGAVAGFGAGGIGATLYASHCFDDSPLFVLVWYSLAIALVTAVGFLAGRRLLQW